MNKILYILAHYPHRTESFIQREIVALRNKGIDLYIYALKGRRGRVGDPHIIYRSDLKTPICLLFFLRSLKHSIPEICLILRYNFKTLKYPFYFLKLIRNLFYIFFLVDWCLKNNISLIHSHFSDIPTDIALAINIISKIPFSFSAHAHDVFTRQINLKIKCSLAESVYTCSEYLKKMVNSKVYMKNVYRMYHGLDFKEKIWNYIYRKRMENFDQLYYHYEEICILALGRYVKKKGYHELISSLKLLMGKKENFKCWIFGYGKEKKLLQRKIDQFDLNKKVMLNDFSPLLHLTDYLFQAHCLIQPSVIDQNGDQDNIPNVILEAQAMGIPVIASELIPFTEVIENRKTGFFFPPGNIKEMAYLLETFIFDTKLKRIIQNSRKQVETKFNINNNIQPLINSIIIK